MKALRRLTLLAILLALATIAPAQDAATLREPIAEPVGEPGLQYHYYEANVDTTLDLALHEPARAGVSDGFTLPDDVRRDYFGLEFWGAIEVPSDGAYTFYTRSDDGSRLYIGDEYVVKNDYPHGATEVSGTIDLKAGRHPITVTYFESYVDETLSVSWEGPGLGKASIPAEVLTQHPRIDIVPPDALTTTELTWPERDIRLTLEVDTRDAVDLAEFHEVLPELLQAEYPKIVDIIGTDDSPLPESVRFSFRPGIDVPAYAGRGIVMSADWFSKNANDLGCALHELTHIVQQYPGFEGKPGWLVEGIADYVRHKIGLDDGWTIPGAYRDGWSYTNGYGVTAAFLVFVEQEYDEDLVVTMNQSLKDKSYKPDLWKTRTEKTVDELWDDFAARYGR